MNVWIFAFWVVLVISGYGRTWTDVDGRKMEADFVSLRGDVVTIRLHRDERRYEVPLSRFSEEDRRYVADQIRKSEKVETTSSRVGKQPEHLVEVSRTLVDAKGKRWSGEDPANCRYTLFYFSAHWCPPCQVFTPKLVSFYNAKKEGSNFEIVFVSSDYGESAMEAYMEAFSMPWPALKFSRIDNVDLSEYKGPGIPCLVLFDSDGEVLSHSYEDGQFVGPSKVLRDLEKLL